MSRTPDEIEMHAENTGNGPTYGPADPRGDNWAMACHLSAFAGYIFPFGHVLGPLLIWLFKGREYSQVERHGREALNFQLSITVYMLVSLLLMVIGIGVLLLVALSLFAVVMILVATIKARNGELYRYPLTIRFLK